MRWKRCGEAPRRVRTIDSGPGPRLVKGSGAHRTSEAAGFAHPPVATTPVREAMKGFRRMIGLKRDKKTHCAEMTLHVSFAPSTTHHTLRQCPRGILENPRAHSSPLRLPHLRLRSHAQPHPSAHLRTTARHYRDCHSIPEDCISKAPKPTHLPKEGKYVPREARTSNDARLRILATAILRPQRPGERGIYPGAEVHSPNPVKRGLVEKPEDSPWSSYRHNALDGQAIVAIESPWAAHKRKHPSADRNQLSRIFWKG